MPRSLRTAALAFALLLAAAFSATGQTQDTNPLLDRLPADYDAAILIPDLGALDTGLASFESTAGLGLGELQDAVGRFKRELGFMHGLDDTGGMAIVLIEAGERPLAVMLLPVVDHDALAVSLDAEPGDLIDVTLPSGDAGVLRKMDGYAILGANRQVVQAYTPARDGDTFAQRVGAHGAQTATRSHIALVARTAEMDKADFTAQMSYFAALGLRHADEILAVDLAPDTFMPMITSLAGLLADGTDAAVVGLRFTADGLGYTEAYKLNDDPAMRELFPGADTEAADANPAAALAKLPDEPIVFAVSGAPSSISFVGWADRLGGLFGLDSLHALGTAKPQLQALFDEADSVATAYYAMTNPAELTSRWMNTVTIFEVQDAEAFAESLEAAVLSLNGAEVPMAGGESITFTTTYEAEDRRLGGIRFDTITFKAHIPESLRTTPTMLVAAALGEIGFTGQAAVVDGHVLLTTFDDLGTMTDALDTLDAGNGLGTGPELRDLRDGHLPRGHTVLGYLDLRGVADTMAPLLSAVGSAAPTVADANTRPIAFALTTGQGEALLELFIPASAVTAMLDEDFEPEVQNSNSPNNGGPAGEPGRLGPGRNTQPGRPSNPRGPDTRPGRGPGRGPGPGPGRSPR